MDPRRASTGNDGNDRYEKLTSREKEVLKLAAEGYNSTEIGARLSISPRTVQTHRANLMRKLGLHNQTELVLYALRRGVLRDPYLQPTDRCRS
ncbi:MAG TPA: response regulator transcription factor [Candidatus Nitrosotenuis sp.]|jgi:DNA-binding NarL/FixJ family response regulator|nr:response regulator transcription factor [Candidatus Nitrosotenuis sp.]